MGRGMENLQISDVLNPAQKGQLYLFKFRGILRPGKKTSQTLQTIKVLLHALTSKAAQMAAQVLVQLAEKNDKSLHKVLPSQAQHCQSPIQASEVPQCSLFSKTLTRTITYCVNLPGNPLSVHPLETIIELYGPKE